MHTKSIVIVDSFLDIRSLSRGDSEGVKQVS